MPATSRARPCVLALSLILPLTAAGTASAQPSSSTQPSSWVDPPARPAAADTAKGLRTEAAKPAAAETPAAAPKAAFALQRPDAEAPRRLAETPAAGAAAKGRATAARALAADYLATVSGPGAAMVGAAPRFYGARVRFYGRQATLADLIAEKRSFVRRWPERRYEPRAIRTACDGETCTVRTIVDFNAASPNRGAVSRGASELVLEVSFAGGRPRIVAETGRVLRRGIQAGTLVPAPGKA